MPIIADGTRVGILNVESNQPNAYTLGHAAVLRRVADQIGWAYYETRQRVSSSAIISPLVRNPKRFYALMEGSRLIKMMRMRFILYNIDYKRGRLIGHFDRDLHPRPAKPSFVYQFGDRCLASLVLQQRQRIFIKDTDEEMQLSPSIRRIAEKGCKEFDIHGPMFGMPVMASGNTAAILVGWSSRGPQEVGEGIQSETDFVRQFARVSERVHRLSMVIANSDQGSPASGAIEVTENPFLLDLNERMKRVDKSVPWSKRELADPAFLKRMTRALLEALTHETVGLLRIRLWRRSRPMSKSRVPKFTIAASISARKATWPGEQRWDQFVGKAKVDGNDTFCAYTIARYEHDPYARHQDQKMFGAADRNDHELHKDPAGSWIVAPIVSLNRWCSQNYQFDGHDEEHGGDGKRVEDDETHLDGKKKHARKNSRQREIELLGFISADMHVPQKRNGELVARDLGRDQSSSSRAAYQRYAMDLISDLLEPLMVQRQY